MRRSSAGSRFHVDHSHAELEFDLVTAGSGSFTLGERNYVLKPGALIWLVPGQQHRLVRSPGLEMWIVALRPELMQPERITELATRPLRMLPGHELIGLNQLLSEVAQDSDEPAAYNAGMAYVAERAWKASRDSRVPRARPLHPAVARALLALRESGATLSLSELAQAAGAAPPYLSRLLIDHTGRSFVDWRNRIRVDRFFEGYRPGVNLLQAALDAGFGSYARFNRVFNDVIGCAPSEWIKSEHHELAPAGTRGEADRTASYGMPSATTLTARQRWTALVPLAAPAIGALLGRTFLDRLPAAPAHGIWGKRQTYEPLDPSLSGPERDQLLAALRRQDLEIAHDVESLVQMHDFADVYARLLSAFDLSTGSLVDAVTALVLVVWVAATRGGDPGRDQVDAVVRQVQGTLGPILSRLKPRAAQEAHTATVYSFVITYRALESARASGDDRALEELSAAARALSHTAFAGDVTSLDLARQGFIHRARQPRGSRPPIGRSNRGRQSLQR